MFKWINGGFHVVMDQVPAGGGGGGGNPPAPAPGGNVTLTQAQFDALMAKIGGAPAPTTPAPTPPAPTTPEPSLADKAKAEREAADLAQKNQRAIESAVRFTGQAKEWATTNAALLPKTVPGLIEAAEKENYPGIVEKDRAIKAGIISEYFAVQANLDSLTPSQKIVIAEYNKLIKTVREERAQEVYDSVFEPHFLMVKGIEKAKQISRGEHDTSDGVASYAKRLEKASKDHYRIGERKNA